ncbi:MAG: 50S ribosomal protein L25 [Candidatus Omnitrophica bacterium]|nr:50S ribosomal protein L25 [Candidatus Omnitrophota bacterium]
MEEIILEAALRKEIGSQEVKHLRQKGFIPGIVYSAGKKSVPVKIERAKLLRFLHTHRAEGVVINLVVKDDVKHKNYNVMVKEMQHDPIKEEIIHVDFNEISLTKVIKAAVPVVTKGEAPGVKQEGGSLDHILWEIEVECLPAAIPKEIVVDISNLKIGDSITIKDIVLPEGIKVLHEPNATVVSVSAPIKVEEAVAPAEAAAPQEPEVIREKKQVPEAGAEGKEKKEEKK